MCETGSVYYLRDLLLQIMISLTSSSILMRFLLGSSMYWYNGLGGGEVRLGAVVTWAHVAVT